MPGRAGQGPASCPWRETSYPFWLQFEKEAIRSPGKWWSRPEGLFLAWGAPHCVQKGKGISPQLCLQPVVSILEGLLTQTCRLTLRSHYPHLDHETVFCYLQKNSEA